MHTPLPSARLRHLFLAAVWLMFLHKVECWLTAEWTVSPFFQRLIHSANWAGKPPEFVLGEAIFLVFCFWLFIGLAMLSLAMSGGRGPYLALAVWGGTFVLEWHHIARMVAAGGYYSGGVTAVVYLSLGVLYWRTLWAEWPPASRPAPATAASR